MVQSSRRLQFPCANDNQIGLRPTNLPGNGFAQFQTIFDATVWEVVEDEFVDANGVAGVALFLFPQRTDLLRCHRGDTSLTSGEQEVIDGNALVRPRCGGSRDSVFGVVGMRGDAQYPLHTGEVESFGGRGGLVRVTHAATVQETWCCGSCSQETAICAKRVTRRIRLSGMTTLPRLSLRLIVATALSVLTATAVTVPLAHAEPASDTGPALTTDPAELDRSLTCHGDLTDSDYNPVLLLHGTTSTVEANWSWNWEPALASENRAYCTVDLPLAGMEDIQVSAENVTHAIRTM